MRIETERLIVRPFQERDLADMTEYMLQRVHSLYEAYPDFTPDKAAGILRERMQGDEFLAIEKKQDGKVIGNLYLGRREHGARELGYVINERYQRQGYAGEAALAAVRQAFADGVKRVYAETCPENIASVRTMEKIGLRREALLRASACFHRDENGNPIYWDTLVMAALPEDGI